MKRVLWLVLAVLAATGLARADATSNGAFEWQGRSIQYKATGASSISVSAESGDDRCTISVGVDGNKQEITVTRSGVAYQGKKLDKKDWKKLEVIVKGDKVEVFFDRKEPEAKLKTPLRHTPTFSRSGDTFSVAYQDGPGLSIVLTGKIAAGKAAPNQIVIAAPPDSIVVKSLEDVPARYRDLIAALLARVEESK